jgi:hypothetical protein
MKWLLSLVLKSNLLFLRFGLSLLISACRAVVRGTFKFKLREMPYHTRMN